MFHVRHKQNGILIYCVILTGSSLGFSREKFVTSPAPKN